MTAAITFNYSDSRDALLKVHIGNGRLLSHTLKNTFEDELSLIEVLGILVSVLIFWPEPKSGSKRDMGI